MAAGPYIRSGWHPGLIGAIVGEHGRYYSRTMGFDHRFETLVAREFGAYFARMTDPDCTWSIWDGDSFIGSVTLDFHDPKTPGMAQLRWFIATRQGTGAGRRLMQAATDHLDAHRIACTLDTIVGLDAATHLYRSFGFTETHRETTTYWGPEVTRLKFERPAK